MNDVLKFVRLDCLAIKPYLTVKNFLIFVAVALIMIFSTGESVVAAGMLMAYGTIFASYPFAVGERNGIDGLYAVLAISRKTVVIGRYLFTLIVDILASLSACLIAFLSALAISNVNDLKEYLIIIPAMVLVFTLIQTIQLPLFFKLGYDKAKLLAYLPFGGLPVVIILFSKLVKGSAGQLPGVIYWLISHPLVILMAIITLWCLAGLTSITLSLKYYRKREF